MIVTIIATVSLVIAVGLAVRYLIRERRKGNKCAGCPYAGECTKYK